MTGDGGRRKGRGDAPFRFSAADRAACAAWLSLQAPGGPGPRQLVEAMRADPAGGPLAWQDRLRCRSATSGKLAADFEAFLASGGALLLCTDPDYPALLAQIPDPPAALHVRGSTSVLWHAQVAIVGSRQASRAGQELAEDFARTFGRAGLGITSGLALGIDAAAHRGALAVSAPTVAVLATGVDRIYPRRHEALAREILAAGGALVSESLPGTPPRAELFPQRNRIISGLGLGTLVVEASLRSGSLITARLAAEQGREVFAVPGSIHDPLARGCHRLIREGAQLVESADEVLAELQPLAASLGQALQARLAEDLSATASGGTATAAAAQRRAPAGLLAALGTQPATPEELAARTGHPVADIQARLIELELADRIEAMPGGRFRKR